MFKNETIAKTYLYLHNRYGDTKLYQFFIGIYFKIIHKIAFIKSINKKRGNYKYDFDKKEWIKKEIFFNLNDFKNTNNTDFDEKVNKTKGCLPIK